MVFPLIALYPEATLGLQEIATMEPMDYCEVAIPKWPVAENGRLVMAWYRIAEDYLELRARANGFMLKGRSIYRYDTPWRQLAAASLAILELCRDCDFAGLTTVAGIYCDEFEIVDLGGFLSSDENLVGFGPTSPYSPFRTDPYTLADMSFLNPNP